MYFGSSEHCDNGVRVRKVWFARVIWSERNVLPRTYGDWNLRVNSGRTVTTGGCSGKLLN